MVVTVLAWSFGVVEKRNHCVNTVVSSTQTESLDDKKESHLFSQPTPDKVQLDLMQNGEQN